MSSKSKTLNTKLLTVYQDEFEKNKSRKKTNIYWAKGTDRKSSEKRGDKYKENITDDTDYSLFLDAGMQKEEFKKPPSFITNIKTPDFKKEMKCYQPEDYVSSEEERQITHYFEQIENIMKQIQERGERMEKKSQLFNKEMKTLQASIMNLEQQIDMELRKSE